MNIAVVSGKGGTGKTTVSTNLSLYISETEKTVLCDLDVEEPNSSQFIKLTDKKTEKKFKFIPDWDEDACTLCGKCQTNCNFSAVLQIAESVIIFPELCHSCYACSELCPENALPMKPKEIGEINYSNINNLKFIEGKLNIGEEQAIPLISQVKDFVSENYKTNIAIFDSPPGTSCPLIESVMDADLVIAVAEPTPFGFNDFKLLAQTLKKLDKQFVIVINKYGSGNDDLEKFSSENDIPIIAKIPDKRSIAELYSKGEIIYKKDKDFKNELDKIFLFIKNYN